MKNAASFSRMVKDEVLKKDFTAHEKTINMVCGIQTGEQWEDDERTAEMRERIRRSFLSTGSVSNPEKDYHLEFSCHDAAEAERLSRELEAFDLRPKHILRGRNTVVYLKEASEICDVLNIIGAHQSLLYFENVRILKEVSGNVNRRVNFETANIGRTVSASLRQIEDIHLIDQTVGLKNLEKGLREMAEARLARPDATISDLAAGFNPPITKSGASHRLRKLSKIAQDLKKHRI